MYEAQKTEIAIWASGNGSNAENLITQLGKQRFSYTIYTNSTQAGVLQRAAKLKVDSIVFDQAELANGELLDMHHTKNTRLILLAGFLKLVPNTFIEAFPKRMINIHPSLLPKFGGKGMYGAKVHEAVIAAGETKSGITIHEVSEVYDTGHILFQASVPILHGETPSSLAQKIHNLEYRHYPKVVKQVIKGL